MCIFKFKLHLKKCAFILGSSSPGAVLDFKGTHFNLCFEGICLMNIAASGRTYDDFFKAMIFPFTWTPEDNSVISDVRILTLKCHLS